MNKKSTFPLCTIDRLSTYHRILDDVLEEGTTHAYSHELAALAEVSSAQFRRDIAAFGNFGNISKGYDIAELHQAITKLFGTDQRKQVVLLGLGNLGKTLLSYRGFTIRGFDIVVVFDVAPDKTNRIIGGRPCYHIDQMEEILPQFSAQMAILATAPESTNDELISRLGNLGIKAVLNFVPKHLIPPEGMFIEQVDISAKLEKLSFLLTNG